MEVRALSPLVQEYPDEDFWEGWRAAVAPAFFALTASPEPSVSRRAEQATPLISTKRDREEDYVEQVSTKRQRVSLEQHPEELALSTSGLTSAPSTSGPRSSHYRDDRDSD